MAVVGKELKAGRLVCEEVFNRDLPLVIPPTTAEQDGQAFVRTARLAALHLDMCYEHLSLEEAALDGRKASTRTYTYNI